MLDKHNLLSRLTSSENIKIELGCGPRKKYRDSIGIDQLDYDEVDIVGDVYDVIRRIPTSSISFIYSSHFFEHIDDMKLLLEELLRILKPEGKMEIIVPHFSNPYFYSDYTHRNRFGLYSFSYFSDDTLFHRTVPKYGQETQYELKSVDLIFKSPNVFPIRYCIKMALGFIFNLTTYAKEFYEENLCYLIPCYEIRYKLFKKIRVKTKENAQ